MPFENEDIKEEAQQAEAQAEAQTEAQAEAQTEAQAAEEAKVAENAEAAEGVVEDAPAEADPAAEVEALKQQLAESAERMKRLQADFENFRRRTRQEKEELSNMVVQDFIKDLLPMIDNFDRAMAAEATDAAQFQQGVEMIYKQLDEVLKAKGLEKIDTAEAKFDPNFHQAVMRVENPDMEDDTIAMELQKGYMVKGKVIRPAMVQVVANA